MTKTTELTYKFETNCSNYEVSYTVGDTTATIRDGKDFIDIPIKELTYILREIQKANDADSQAV